MAVQTINPIEDKRWINFITSSREANIFHHPAWLKLINKQYNYPVFAVCNINSSNEITAGIPFCEVSGLTLKKKWVSLPFSDYSLPLSCNNDQLKEIESYIIEQHKKGKLSSAEIYWQLDSENGFTTDPSYVYHITELNQDEKVLLNSFNRTKIQGISKSVKEGLSAGFSTDLSAVETFYNLHLKTRKKLGVPIQPKKFFTNLYEEIIKPGYGFLVIISKDNIEMAAGLFMGFNDTLTYKYNASDPDYLEYRPNNLIIWTSMQEAIKRGYKYYDFGKSDLANSGLRSFKKGWAAVEKPLYYSYFPALPAAGTSFNFLKDKLVAPVIKSSPVFVCKLIGELAYKYFPSI